MTSLVVASLLVSLSGWTAPASSPRAVQEGQAPVSCWSLTAFSRSLLDSDWEPLENPLGAAVEFDSYRPGELGWEAGFAYSGDEDGPLELTFAEFYLGVRKTWGERSTHPYVGVGASYMDAELELSGVGSASESAFGGYVRGGVNFDVGRHLRIGFDVRALGGTDFDGLESAYAQAGVVLGYTL
jgi:hypothetical protein